MQKFVIKQNIKLNTKGLSIIEVMMAAAISLVVILGIGSALNNVFSMQKISNQKIQKLETQNQLINAINSPDICLEAIKSSGSNKVDLSSPSNKKILSFVPYLPSPGSEKIIATGQPLATSTPGLTVDSIYLSNYSGSASNYLADLIVNLDSSSSTNFSFKPLVFKVRLNIDSSTPINNADITSCSSKISSNFYQVKNFTGGKTATAFCNGSDIVIGCTGARDKNLSDSCSEQDCGLIGALPIGPPSYPNNGCMVRIDDDPGTEATVVAFCKSN